MSWTNWVVQSEGIEGAVRGIKDRPGAQPDQRMRLKTRNMEDGAMIMQSGSCVADELTLDLPS